MLFFLGFLLAASAALGAVSLALLLASVFLLLASVVLLLASVAHEIKHLKTMFAEARWYLS